FYLKLNAPRAQRAAILTLTLNGTDETFWRFLNCLRPAGAHTAVDPNDGGGDQIGKSRAGFGAPHADRRSGAIISDVELSHDGADIGTDPSDPATNATRSSPAEHSHSCSPAARQRAARRNDLFRNVIVRLASNDRPERHRNRQENRPREHGQGEYDDKRVQATLSRHHRRRHLPVHV